MPPTCQKWQFTRSPFGQIWERQSIETDRRRIKWYGRKDRRTVLLGYKDREIYNFSSKIIAWWWSAIFHGRYIINKTFIVYLVSLSTYLVSPAMIFNTLYLFDIYTGVRWITVGRCTSPRRASLLTYNSASMIR